LAFVVHVNVPALLEKVVPCLLLTLLTYLSGALFAQLWLLNFVNLATGLYSL